MKETAGTGALRTLLVHAAHVGELRKRFLSLHVFEHIVVLVLRVSLNGRFWDVEWICRWPPNEAARLTFKS